MSKLNHTIAPGVYRHYKGGEYNVFVNATHTETNEGLVVYASATGDPQLWARPLHNFSEDVELDGRLVPRFKFVRSFKNDE